MSEEFDFAGRLARATGTAPPDPATAGARPRPAPPMPETLPRLPKAEAPPRDEQTHLLTQLARFNLVFRIAIPGALAAWTGHAMAVDVIRGLEAEIALATSGIEQSLAEDTAEQ